MTWAIDRAFLKGLPWRQIAMGAIILGVLLSAYYQGKKNAYSALKPKIEAAEKTARESQEKAQYLTKLLETQNAIHQTAQQLSEERRNETARTDRVYRALLDSLRDRPEQRTPQGIPEAASIGTVGCTGAGLARPDGDFLAGYAADAAKQASALAECRERYQSAKEQLESLATE